MLANRVRNSLLLLATLAVGAIAIAGEFLGSIQTTRIPTSYPVKGVTIGPYNCDYNGTDQTPIVQALAAGHKHLDIVGPGTFTFTAPVTSSLDDITISSRSGVTLVPVASGETSLDSALAALIPGVSARMTNAMRRHTKAGTRTETYQLSPSRSRLTLRGSPITNVATIKLSSTTDFASSTALASGLPDAARKRAFREFRQATWQHRTTILRGDSSTILPG